MRRVSPKYNSIAHNWVNRYLIDRSFMKIWTCGSSPPSGSRNAWTQIKNVNGASRLSNFWNFFRRNPNDFVWDQDAILLIDYLPKGQTINTECSSSLLVQLKDILKEKRHGKVTKVILFLHDNATAYRALATQKKLAYLGVPVSWSPTLLSGSDPIRLRPVIWTEETIERLPFFVRRGGHCCRGDLAGRTTFSIFLSGLQKLEQRAKKCIELRGECVE